MKSDLKKHELLKILSKQRQDNSTPLGVPFENILKSMQINKTYLDFISGELYGNDEIGFFNNGINPKGLYAKKLGNSAYSSEKYKRTHIKEVWVLVRNWTALVVAVFTIPFQIYRHLDSKAQKETPLKPQDYELQTLEKQLQTKSNQLKEKDNEVINKENKNLPKKETD